MRLLLAEDERHLSSALCEIFSKQKYEVDPVYDGQSALEYIRSGVYDLVILDIMMPEMDGFEVLERLRADEAAKDIPVVFLTADEEPETRARAEAAGVQDIVGKPFKKEELLSVVAKYC